jgi:hypothetical protein
MMKLAFLTFFDRGLRLAPAAIVSPRAEALAAVSGFLNRDLRHAPVRDAEKIVQRWGRDPETGKLAAHWSERPAETPAPAAPVDDLAEHRARRTPRYRSRFVWPDRRSA